MAMEGGDWQAVETRRGGNALDLLSVHSAPPTLSL
jgi:hypothetical protein